MSIKTQILVETTRTQKDALTSVLEENGATLTEWITDNIAEATTDYSVEPMTAPPDLSALTDLADDKRVMGALSDVAWAFANDDTTYLSHDIHPYPAKFIPQIPRNIIAQLSRPGETVWDPFGGSGTTALECVLLGRQAVSSDVNPLSEVIGKGKIVTLTKEDEDFLTGITEEPRNPFNRSRNASCYCAQRSCKMEATPNVPGFLVEPKGIQSRHHQMRFA